MAIRMLQDAAERGEIDPWDVDVIAVIDGFLDQLQQRLAGPARSNPHPAKFEHDLAESSEAFLAASVLVGLKAELLEHANFPPEIDGEPLDEGDDLQPEPALPNLLPQRPEQQLLRRPVAPPPLQRPVSLGELIRQLEEIAERLEQEERRPRQRGARRYSERMAIAQVAALAHREKLPETTAALNLFLQTSWPGQEGEGWLAFDALVGAWEAWSAGSPEEDLDRDRVGVFWALLFLSSQGKVELHQHGGLYGPLSLRRLRATVSLAEGMSSVEGSASMPAPESIAA